MYKSSIFGILLVLGHYLNAQEAFTATYRMADNDNFDLRDGNANGLPLTLEQIENINRDYRNIKSYYKLLYNKGQSIFRYDTMVIPEKSLIMQNPSGMSEMIALHQKDFNTNKLHISRGNLPYDKRVESPLTAIGAWQLVDQDTVINNLNCQKALLPEMNVVAWYSTKWVVPDGPWHYAGLPGLIVSIHQGDQHKWILEALHVGEPKEFAFNIDTEAEVIDFFAYQKKYQGPVKPFK